MFIFFRFDGIDYRIFKEVTKHWNVSMNIHIATTNGSSPYRDMIKSVQNSRSNIALCSIWLIPRHLKVVDMSIPYEEISVNFLVPMSALIDDAAAIYYSLSKEVWLTYTFCLLFLSVFLTAITKSKFNRNDKRKCLTEYMFYLVEIATGHGVHYSPRHAFTRYIFIRCA